MARPRSALIDGSDLLHELFAIANIDPTEDGSVVSLSKRLQVTHQYVSRLRNGQKVSHRTADEYRALLTMNPGSSDESLQVQHQGQTYRVGLTNKRVSVQDRNQTLVEGATRAGVIESALAHLLRAGKRP